MRKRPLHFFNVGFPPTCHHPHCGFLAKSWEATLLLNHYPKCNSQLLSPHFERNLPTSWLDPSVVKGFCVMPTGARGGHVERRESRNLGLTLSQIPLDLWSRKQSVGWRPVRKRESIMRLSRLRLTAWVRTHEWVESTFDSSQIFDSWVKTPDSFDSWVNSSWHYLKMAPPNVPILHLKHEIF